MAAVALEWLGAQPTVVAPVASARTVGQLAEIVSMTQVQLSSQEVAQLSSIG